MNHHWRQSWGAGRGLRVQGHRIWVPYVELDKEKCNLGEGTWASEFKCWP